MKYVLYGLFAAVLLIAPTKATFAAEGGISLPPDAIGVSEADFQQIKSDSQTCGLVGKCTPLLEKVRGKIIFRAEHYGEMYKVLLGDGGQRIIRYLPDGFYTYGTRTFLVKDGIRYRLTKNNAAEKIRATSYYGAVTMATVVNSAYMNTQVKDCSQILSEWESRKDQLPFSVTYDYCEEGSIAGLNQRSGMAGKLIMNVDDKGRMFYVRPNYYWETVHEISSNNEAAFTTIKKLSTTIDANVINKLVPGRNL